MNPYVGKGKDILTLIQADNSKYSSCKCDSRISLFMRLLGGSVELCRSRKYKPPEARLPVLSGFRSVGGRSRTVLASRQHNCKMNTFLLLSYLRSRTFPLFR